MTTSAGTSFPSRFTRIDDLTRSDHNHLLPEDECLFFGDYTARKGWAHSATNQLILNYKTRARPKAGFISALDPRFMPLRNPTFGCLCLASAQDHPQTQTGEQHRDAGLEQDHDPWPPAQ